MISSFCLIPYRKKNNVNTYIYITSWNFPLTTLSIISLILVYLGNESWIIFSIFHWKISDFFFLQRWEYVLFDYLLAVFLFNKLYYSIVEYILIINLSYNIIAPSTMTYDCTRLSSLVTILQQKKHDKYIYIYIYILRYMSNLL